jgi:uncharacterized protein YkwD
MRVVFLATILGAVATYIGVQTYHDKRPSVHVTQKKAPMLSLEQERQNSFNYLNELRFKAGMSPFLYNRYLEKSAQSHADYLTYHDKTGHYEEAGESGFSGVLPKDRILKAGYQTPLSMENVSSQTIGYKKSIEGLFSAIYHRFGFLDFQVDEVGVGVSQSSQDSSKTAYVYNMGVYEINDLCSGESYQGRGDYTYHICANEAFRIEKQAFDKAYHACYIRNQKVVTYPYADQEEVPPAFFDEEPDPLPEYRVSGFPISIQFNPAYFQYVKLKSFELFLGEKKVEETLLYDHISDINSYFKRNEFALFPLKRLAWGSEYHVKVVYEVSGKVYHKRWSFKTQKLSSNPIMIDKKKSEVKISTLHPTVLYFPPQHKCDILDDIEYDSKLDISFIDKNTIKIETRAKGVFKITVSGREVTLRVGE